MKVSTVSPAPTARASHSSTRINYLLPQSRYEPQIPSLVRVKESIEVDKRRQTGWSHYSLQLDRTLINVRLWMMEMSTSAKKTSLLIYDLKVDDLTSPMRLIHLCGFSVWLENGTGWMWVL